MHSAPLRGQPSPGVLLALPRVPAQAGAPEHGGPWCCSRHESRWTGEMGTVMTSCRGPCCVDAAARGFFVLYFGHNGGWGATWEGCPEVLRTCHRMLETEACIRHSPPPTPVCTREETEAQRGLGQPRVCPLWPCSGPEGMVSSRPSDWQAAAL